MPEPREGAGPASAASSTGLSAGARAAVAAAWLTIAAVVLRIASGGGSLIGVRFVLDTEPLLVVLVGCGLLAAAGAVLIGTARRHDWATRVSDVAAVLAVPGFLLLLAEGHDSAVFGIVAAAVALSAPRLDRARSAI